MAHPLIWPGKYFFYPVGNTSAVCLTRDLPPEEPANILLLGCGDPRNVLFTIFCEPQNMGRRLDFTCSDHDPGVLARNVLLLTMIVDRQHSWSDIWNIYYHVYLDKNTNLLLVEHCKKLVGLSGSLQQWKASTYGSWVRMCTEYTLEELRRHWSLYIGFQDLPKERMTSLRSAFAKVFGEVSKKGTLLSTARSSGPLMMKAAEVCTKQGKNYWKTGVTFSDPQQTKSATLLNPTFVYSLAGESCSIHYGTDPLTGFHLAALFANAKGPVSTSDAVNAAKAEFQNWCTTFHMAISAAIYAPTIRFFLGEATAVCKTLDGFASTGTLILGTPVAQWNTQLIKLSRDEYCSGPGGAPDSFNVIDSSNLDDHIGLLNVLIAAVPLLSTSTQSSVLYAESLLFSGQDPTKEFTERLYTNLTNIGLLLGVCPVDYLSGFNTRSNTSEIFIQLATKGDVTQFHQVTTWKSPISGDAVRHSTHTGQPLHPVFDPSQLGTLLYDTYHQIFELEDAQNFFKRNSENILKAISHSNMIHYIRESFVLLLKLIKNRLSIPEAQWSEVMDRFFDLVAEDKTLPMDTVNHQDLCGQLYRHGVYTVPIYRFERLPKLGRMASWDTIPPLVRIILVIPREKLAVMEESEQVATPPLQCDVRGRWSHNIFTSVHAAFGKAIPAGTKARPRIVFQEDLEKWKGSSPLVASFTMPTRLLTSIEPMEELNVCLSLRSSPGTVMFIKKLGLTLNIFTAKFTDESSVHVLPEQPLPSRTPQSTMPAAAVPKPAFSNIGKLSPVVIELDEQCDLVVSLTGKVSVDDGRVQTLFQAGATPQISQISPSVMRVAFGAYMQDILYPFPVIGSQHRLRLARKSLYIEIVAPVFGPFKSGGMRLNPYPVVSANGYLNPWNIHRLNLSCLPALNKKATDVYSWLNPHVGSMLSSRERSQIKKHTKDTSMFVKQTIHTIIVRSSGIQGGPPQRVFALRDKETRNCDTLVFVSDLKFDLHSHTIVCEAYVLPLTHDLLPKIEIIFSKLVVNGNIFNVAVFEGEMEAWKQLLPALVERCRTTWKHEANCEYKSQGKVPLTNMMEMDPICSCGRGKDVEGMLKVNLWNKLAPYVTRIALSPLFAVSYLETVGRDPARYMCFVCRGKGKPKLMKCTACQKVRYCSRDCQKKDWKAHKARCKP